MPRRGFDNRSRVPMFPVEGVATLRSDLVDGQRFGSASCSSGLFSLIGTELRVKNSTLHEGTHYYRCYTPDEYTGGSISDRYIREDMFVQLPQPAQNQIDINMVKKAYILSNLRPVRGRFFYDTDRADAFGAISVAMGGTFSHTDDACDFICSLFDIDYLRGFAHGFDGSDIDRVSTTEIARTGYRDGVACYEAMSNEVGGDF